MDPPKMMWPSLPRVINQLSTKLANPVLPETSPRLLENPPNLRASKSPNQPPKNQSELNRYPNKCQMTWTWWPRISISSAGRLLRATWSLSSRDNSRAETWLRDKLGLVRRLMRKKSQLIVWNSRVFPRRSRRFSRKFVNPLSCTKLRIFQLSLSFGVLRG